MMISNLIRLTMNCTNFSKDILFCCGKGCRAKSPSLRPQKVGNYDVGKNIRIYPRFG